MVTATVNRKATSFPITAIVLVALASFIVTERSWGYRKPIQRDVSIYAVIGHELLSGRPLYSDLLELRPPAVMVTFAVGEAIIGYGRHTIFLLYITATIITLLGIYYAASVGEGGATAGLWAAAFWAVLSGSYGLEAGEPNTEVFMNACLTWAFALWVRAGETSNWLKRSLEIGALFALASLYKHLVIVCPMLLAIAHIAFPPSDQHEGRRRGALIDVVVIGAVGIGVWGGVTGYFAATGRFEIFREIMIGTSLDYASSTGLLPVERPSAISVLLRNFFAPLRHKAEFVLNMLNPLAMLAGLGGAIGVFRNRRRWALLLAFAVATWIAIAAPGQFYGHYYQLWLPPLIIGAGWAIGLSGSVITKRKLGWLPHVIGAAMLSLLILQQLPFYRMNAAGDWAPIESPEAMAAEPLAREINSLLAPGETFYEWGGNPSLFFYTQRRAPSGILMVWWFLEGRLSAQLSQQVIADLERAQPELLVVAEKSWPENPAEQPVSSWLAQRYYPLSEDNERGPFALYVRRGGNLEARLRSTLR